MKDGVARILALGTIAFVAIAQLWPGLSDNLSPPIGWDHGAHLGKAILTWNHLLPALRGWTDLVETGVPLNTVYGPAGLLWVLAFRCFTTSLEWHQTYALAFAGFRILVGMSAYRLTRVIGAGRLGAVAAAVIALADIGTHSEGGWFYDVLYGVWPMSLAMTVLFFGIADLLVFVEAGAATTKGRRARARATLLLGVALFAHQMCLVAIAMLVPVLVIVRATDGRENGTTRETLERTLPVVAIAAMIASWWMLPMLGLSAWLDDHGQLATTTQDIGARMTHGEGIWSTGAWEGVLVALGILSSVFTRGSRRFVAVLALVASIVHTAGWFVSFDMARWLPPLGRIVFPRMMMIAKPLYFALAGMVVHDIFARTAPSVRAVMSKPSGVFGAVLTAALIAPFTPDIPQAINDVLLHREVVTTETLNEWPDFNAAWQWVREQPRDVFYRVAYVNDGTHLAQASPAYTDRPGHIGGVLVGEAFRNTPDSLDPDVLRAINVRYVVIFSSPPARLSTQCSDVAQFGRARICELRDWSSQVVSDASAVRHPLVSHLEDARVVFDPDGAQAIVVRRALAPGWIAEADGVEIPITPERIVDSPHLRLMRLTIPPGAHEVVLRYRSTRALDVLGMLFTLLGLGGVFLLTVRGTRMDSLRASIVIRIERLTSRIPPRGREAIHAYWPAIACALPVLGLLLMLGRNASGTQLAYHVGEATIRILRGAGDEVCEDPAPGGGIRCASQPSIVIERTSSLVDGRYRSCITAGPARGMPLRFTWTTLSFSSLRLAGGVSDGAYQRGAGGPILLRARIDEGTPLELAVPNGGAWMEGMTTVESGEHRLEIEITPSSTTQRDFCFDAVVH